MLRFMRMGTTFDIYVYYTNSPNAHQEQLVIIVYPAERNASTSPTIKQTPPLCPAHLSSLLPCPDQAWTSSPRGQPARLGVAHAG